MLTKSYVFDIIKMCLERWLSWLKAHDWKSCVPHIFGTEGSNPSLSARFVLSAYIFRNTLSDDHALSVFYC